MISYQEKGPDGVLTLCVAGTHSNCGKTTVSMGIMSALIRRGYSVQAFKVGPDFIDPGHHRRITGRDSHNLDSWMMGLETNREIFTRYARDAHVAVVEGVMGLFDGFSGKDEAGSTAQMAKWLHLPVILVIDAHAMARSAAAMAMGYVHFDPDLRISGVIFNRVGSSTHEGMLREAMEAFPRTPVFGCLPRNEELEIPSRHLGLVTDEDFHLNEKAMERLGRWIEDHVDLDRLLEDGGGHTLLTERVTGPGGTPLDGVRIGIARDEAFCFYYEENLRLLKEAGARLVPFSPLRTSRLPEGIQGLVLGGGYPELHCRTLSENRDLLKEIKAFGMAGGPIYAECGGFMFLMEEIQDLHGQVYPMVGIFPTAARMEERLRTLGYREITTVKESILGPGGTRVRGHEFHYSNIRDGDPMPDAIYEMTDRRRTAQYGEGFLVNRVLGSYVHLHWGSNPGVAKHFVDSCRMYGQK